MSGVADALRRGAVAVLATHLGPSLSSIAPARRTLTPRLAGISERHHIALTYDDGPDASSTPRFLDLLDEYDVRATFFVLGEHVRAHRSLVRTMSEAGHELAVHGWTHTCLARVRPGTLTSDLRRAKREVEDLTGAPSRWYRPPYGVLTTEGVVAAGAAGLRPVLWSTWGRDWSAHATPASIERKVERVLRPGGTVLLHDSDRTAAPGSWRGTLAASRLLLEGWADRDIPVGPLAEHW